MLILLKFCLHLWPNYFYIFNLPGSPWGRNPHNLVVSSISPTLKDCSTRTRQEADGSVQDSGGVRGEWQVCASLYQTFSVVGEVQTPPTHDRLPSLLLLPAGAPDGALLPGVCSEEMPGVRESRGPRLHIRQGELAGGRGEHSSCRQETYIETVLLIENSPLGRSL